MSVVALGSISKKLPAEHSSPKPRTAAALVVPGDSAAPPLATRGSSREPRSTALQPVVSAKYLQARRGTVTHNAVRNAAGGRAKCLRGKMDSIAAGESKACMVYGIIYSII